MLLEFIQVEENMTLEERTKRQLVMRQIFFSEKIDKNAFNHIKSKEWLNVQVKDLCQTILNSKDKSKDLEKIRVIYKAQREEAIADSLGPFYRGVSKNGLFGWQIMCMVGRR